MPWTSPNPHVGTTTRAGRAHYDRPAVVQIRDEIGDCVQCWWSVVEALLRTGYYKDLNDEVFPLLPPLQRGHEEKAEAAARKTAEAAAWKTAKARVAADRRASIVESPSTSGKPSRTYGQDGDTMAVIDMLGAAAAHPPLLRRPPMPPAPATVDIDATLAQREQALCAVRTACPELDRAPMSGRHCSPSATDRQPLPADSSNPARCARHSPPAPPATSDAPGPELSGRRLGCNCYLSARGPTPSAFVKAKTPGCRHQPQILSRRGDTGRLVEHPPSRRTGHCRDHERNTHDRPQPRRRHRRSAAP